MRDAKDQQRYLRTDVYSPQIAKRYWDWFSYGNLYYTRRTVGPDVGVDQTMWATLVLGWTRLIGAKTCLGMTVNPSRRRLA